MRDTPLANSWYGMLWWWNARLNHTHWDPLNKKDTACCSMLPYGEQGRTFASNNGWQSGYGWTRHTYCNTHCNAIMSHTAPICMCGCVSRATRTMIARHTYCNMHCITHVNIKKEALTTWQTCMRVHHEKCVGLSTCVCQALDHCNTLQYTATHDSTLQHTATHCNTLQHTVTHCNTL